MADEVVEGTAVEESADPVGPPGSGSPAPGALVTRENTVLQPLNVGEVKAAMQEYQRGLQSLLDESDYQDAGSDGRFVKKSGWRKIATWFGLSVEVVRERVERDEHGEPLRASVVARALAPNGRFMEGDGHCSVSERRFSQARGRQKLENDLIGTATTRAKNRAISDLVGMGDVSAEEMETAAPPFGPAADHGLEEKLIKALHTFVGPEKITAVIEALDKDAGGYLPRISARAVCLAAAARIEGASEPTTTKENDGSSDAAEAADDGGEGGAERGADPAEPVEAGAGAEEAS